MKPQEIKEFIRVKKRKSFCYELNYWPNKRRIGEI
jgi:hypothetical protein